MSGAGAGLPLGFSPELWEGWEFDPTNGGILSRTLSNEYRVHVWFDDRHKYTPIKRYNLCLFGREPEYFTFCTEPDCLAWADDYAAKNGGWFGIEERGEGE